jgi:hypothetical protein
MRSIILVSPEKTKEKYVPRTRMRSARIIKHFTRSKGTRASPARQQIRIKHNQLFFLRKNGDLERTIRAKERVKKKRIFAQKPRTDGGDSSYYTKRIFVQEPRTDGGGSYHKRRIFGQKPRTDGNDFYYKPLAPQRPNPPKEGNPVKDKKYRTSAEPSSLQQVSRLSSRSPSPSVSKAAPSSKKTLKPAMLNFSKML